MTDTKKALMRFYKVAPASIQEFLLTNKPRAEIDVLTNKYTLSQEKSQILEADILMTILGITDLTALPDNIQTNLGVDSEMADKIVSDIDSNIFSQIRHGLNVVHGYEAEEERAAPLPTDEKKSVQTTSEPAASDPVMSSILGQNRRPGAQPDPYREPIDEE